MPWLNLERRADMPCVLCRTGLGMTKRKAVYDPTASKCYKCNSEWDNEIAEVEPGDPCPACGYELKKCIIGYDQVCVKCGDWI